MACIGSVQGTHLRSALSGAALHQGCRASRAARPVTQQIDAIQRLLGKVVSSAASKTITIAFHSYSEHPLYHKRIQKTSRIIAHDEKNSASIGDYVAIVPCRPVSKRKRFVLEKIIKKFEYAVDETTGEVIGIGNIQDNESASSSQENLGIPAEQLA